MRYRESGLGEFLCGFCAFVGATEFFVPSVPCILLLFSPLSFLNLSFSFFGFLFCLLCRLIHSSALRALSFVYSSSIIKTERTTLYSRAVYNAGRVHCIHISHRIVQLAACSVGQSHNGKEKKSGQEGQEGQEGFKAPQISLQNRPDDNVRAILISTQAVLYCQLLTPLLLS